MNINRRGFWGSVIGVIAGTSIPFVAIKAKKKPAESDRISFCILTEGEKIQGTPLEGVTWNEEKRQVEFSFANIMIKRDLDVKGYQFYDSLGNMFIQLDKPRFLPKGYNLHVTYNLDTGEDFRWVGRLLAKTANASLVRG